MLTDEGAAAINRFDSVFKRWRETHPGGRFSEFSTERALRHIVELERPHATLGPRLINAGGKWEVGVSAAELVLAEAPVDETKRICEYGCGTLRVGAYFIARQDPGCYFGMDVSEGFISIGKDLVGQTLIESKRPSLGTIPALIDEAASASIDMLFSQNVACHVHPDEEDIFFENHRRICHKPGSIAVMHATVASEPIRYQESGWARPIQFYVDAMKPLQLSRVPTPLKSMVRNGVSVQTYYLTFQRML